MAFFVKDSLYYYMLLDCSYKFRVFLKEKRQKTHHVDFYVFLHMYECVNLFIDWLIYWSWQWWLPASFFEWIDQSFQGLYLLILVPETQKEKLCQGKLGLTWGWVNHILLSESLWCVWLKSLQASQAGLSGLSPCLPCNYVGLLHNVLAKGQRSMITIWVMIKSSPMTSHS